MFKQRKLGKQVIQNNKKLKDIKQWKRNWVFFAP